MPGNVCARAGEVRSAMKTANREIRGIRTDDLLRFEIMASSLFASAYRDAVQSMIW
jgi:hypothetical protein